MAFSSFNKNKLTYKIEVIMKQRGVRLICIVSIFRMYKMLSIFYGSSTSTYIVDEHFLNQS